MRFILWTAAIALVIAALAAAGLAVFGELPAPVREVTLPVDLP